MDLLPSDFGDRPALVPMVRAELRADGFGQALEIVGHDRGFFEPERQASIADLEVAAVDGHYHRLYRGVDRDLVEAPVVKGEMRIGRKCGQVGRQPRVEARVSWHQIRVLVAWRQSASRNVT